jgi:hypothetical protein
MSGSFPKVWNLHELFKLGMDAQLASPIGMFHKLLTSFFLFQIWEDLQQDFIFPST